MNIRSCIRHGALRQVINNFKVDGLTRARNRQLYILYFLVASYSVLAFSQFVLGCPVKQGISYQPFLGTPPGMDRMDPKKTLPKPKQTDHRKAAGPMAPGVHKLRILLRDLLKDV